MHRKRVAIIIPGGIGTGKDNLGVPVLERIVLRLSMQFDVTVYQLYPRNKGFRHEGFDLVDIYSRTVIIKFIKFLAIFIARHLKARYSIVHGFWALPGGFLAVLVGKLFGIRSFVSVLGGDAISLPGIGYGQLLSPLKRSLIFWALRRGDKVIALTQYLVDKLAEAGFQRQDIRIIPWGIETEVFTYLEKPIGMPIQFLCIGNLYPVKDHKTSIKAFQLINNKIPSHLTIIGEGVLGEELKALVSELGIDNSVSFFSTMPYDQLVAHYHKADVLLHTSLSEGQSEVVTEAMSCGVAVCGTKVGLMYDLPSCCTAVQVGSFDELAAVTLRLLHSGELEQKKHIAYRWANSHNLDWTVKMLVDLYAG
jgi:glycosyltransferase involved in cell wall biosynthesis